MTALDADVLILTPSHQWPIGGVLSPEARAAVLGWAQRTGALVLEDDYDAEYRYDRAPIGAIQGLDPDRVVYAGTASKTLAARVPPRLAHPAAGPRRTGRRGQAARRPGLTHPRPAHLRRLPLARRVRPPPPPHAPHLPTPARCAPRCPRASTCRSSSPSASPPACTSSPGSPTTYDENAVVAAAAAEGVAIAPVSRVPARATTPRGADLRLLEPRRTSHRRRRHASRPSDRDARVEQMSRRHEAATRRRSGRCPANAMPGIKVWRSEVPTGVELRPLRTWHRRPTRRGRTTPR